MWWGWLCPHDQGWNALTSPSERCWNISPSRILGFSLHTTTLFPAITRLAPIFFGDMVASDGRNFVASLFTLTESFWTESLLLQIFRSWFEYGFIFGLNTTLLPSSEPSSWWKCNEFSRWIYCTLNILSFAVWIYKFILAFRIVYGSDLDDQNVGEEMWRLVKIYGYRRFWH